MNFIKNGNYYIIAKYRDFEKPEIIPLKQNWYLNGGQDEFIYGNDLAAIDLVTTKYSSIDAFKRMLIKEGILKNDFVDLYIVHKHKYNNQEYLNESELLFNKKDYRTDLVRKMANNRLNNIETKQKDKDLEDFYNRFFNKIKNRLSFKKFFTAPFRPNNEYISQEILTENENPYSLKYKIDITNYIYTRNTANMWNLYDTLIKKYPDVNESTLGDYIVREYAYMLNLRNNRRIDETEILKMIDKKQVIGQVTMEDYLKSLQSKSDEIKEPVYDTVEDLAEQARKLRDELFDDPKLNVLAEKYNIYEIVSMLDSKALNNLSPKDRFKLGLIDLINYRNIIDQQKRGANGNKRY